MAEKEKEPDKLEAILESLLVLQSRAMELAAGSGLKGDQLEAILNRVGANSADSMRKAMKPENESPPLVSVFNPQGDRDFPKAPLTRQTFLNGHPEHSSESSKHADMLTPAEVTAYNELGDAALAAGGLLEARNGLYKAELRLRNTQLHVTVPVANLDTRSNLPPTLILLCHELKTGESMFDLNSLLSEVTRLKEEVQILRGEGGAALVTTAAPVPPRSGRPPTLRPATDGSLAAVQASLNQASHAELAR